VVVVVVVVVEVGHATEHCSRSQVLMHVGRRDQTSAASSAGSDAPGSSVIVVTVMAADSAHSRSSSGRRSGSLAVLRGRLRYRGRGARSAHPTCKRRGRMGRGGRGVETAQTERGQQIVRRHPVREKRLIRQRHRHELTVVVAEDRVAREGVRVLDSEERREVRLAVVEQRGRRARACVVAGRGGLRVGRRQIGGARVKAERGTQSALGGISEHRGDGGIESGQRSGRGRASVGEGGRHAGSLECQLGRGGRAVGAVDDGQLDQLLALQL
ncbi:hypothetical protein PENTCL1PPCAC_18990, partial [Pristionchus entomophagus]